MPLQCTFISYGIRDVCTVYIVYIVQYTYRRCSAECWPFGHSFRFGCLGSGSGSRSGVLVADFGPTINTKEALFLLLLLLLLLLLHLVAPLVRFSAAMLQLFSFSL